jgi:hypothetical protein
MRLEGWLILNRAYIKLGRLALDSGIYKQNIAGITAYILDHMVTEKYNLSILHVTQL